MVRSNTRAAVRTVVGASVRMTTQAGTNRAHMMKISQTPVMLASIITTAPSQPPEGTSYIELSSEAAGDTHAFPPQPDTMLSQVNLVPKSRLCSLSACWLGHSLNWWGGTTC